MLATRKAKYSVDFRVPSLVIPILSDFSTNKTMVALPNSCQPTIAAESTEQMYVRFIFGLLLCHGYCKARALEILSNA